MPPRASMRPWYRVARAMADVTLRLLLVRRVVGLSRLPPSGPLIVAANHGSFWDPPVLGATLPRELSSMTRASFLALPGVGALLASLGAFPVRRGMADRRAFRTAQAVLERGGAVLVFPEGGRMKDGRLHKGLPGVGLLAALTRAPIVPVYLAGTNRIRRCIARREVVRIAIGEPLPGALWGPTGTTSTPAGRPLHQAISDRVMQEIARLRDEIEAHQPGSATTPAPGAPPQGTISNDRGGRGS